MAIMGGWEMFVRNGMGVVGGGVGFVMGRWKIFKASIAFLSYENNIF